MNTDRIRQFEQRIRNHRMLMVNGPRDYAYRIHAGYVRRLVAAIRRLRTRNPA